MNEIVPISEDFLGNYLRICVSPGGVAQWIECWPANQGAISSIPSQGTCLGFGTGLQVGVQEATTH